MKIESSILCNRIGAWLDECAQAYKDAKDEATSNRRRLIYEGALGLAEESVFSVNATNCGLFAVIHSVKYNPNKE